jgi:hypothetical protein
MLYTNSQGMPVLQLPLHRATTTVVQMAAPDPEIMDGSDIYSVTKIQ